MHPQLYALAPGTLKTSNHPTDFARKMIRRIWVRGLRCFMMFLPKKGEKWWSKKADVTWAPKFDPRRPQDLCQRYPCAADLKRLAREASDAPDCPKVKAAYIIYILYDTWTAHKLELQMLEFLVIDNSCYIVWQCRTLQAESPKKQPHSAAASGACSSCSPGLGGMAEAACEVKSQLRPKLGDDLHH